MDDNNKWNELNSIIENIDVNNTLKRPIQYDIRDKLDNLDDIKGVDVGLIDKIKKLSGKIGLTKNDKQNIKTFWTSVYNAKNKTAPKKKSKKDSYEKIEEEDDEDDNNIPENNIKYEQTWTNKKYVDIVNDHIALGKKIIINNFINKPVMYFIITKLPDPLKLNRIICKIGFTSDINTRITKYKELKCDFYLIALKCVDNIQTEKKFHNMIKQMKEHLYIDNIVIKEKIKDEYYVFDTTLSDEFNAIKEDTTHEMLQQIDHAITMVNDTKTHLNDLKAKINNLKN